jgi:hypothetical protein
MRPGGREGHQVVDHDQVERRLVLLRLQLHGDRQQRHLASEDCVLLMFARTASFCSKLPTSPFRPPHIKVISGALPVLFVYSYGSEIAGYPSSNLFLVWI